MEFSALESIEILPNEQNKNALFNERENGITHTVYEAEVILFSFVKRGDVDGLRKYMEQLFRNKIVVGKLSDDKLRQMQYWAVCCITLATRYAIQGGLDETTAFNLSDEYIMAVDKMTRVEDIFAFLQNKSIELTKLVEKNSHNAKYPYAVRKCIHFINTNLHNELNLDILSNECELSRDYLSVLFKKCTGSTVLQYIKKQRLNAAKDMLNGKCSSSEVGYYLGFCSESYFIQCFKKEFGMTPKEYANSLKF